MSTNIKVGLICLILVLAMVGATIAGAYFVFKPDEGEAPGEAGNSDSSGGDNNSTGGNSSNNTNNSNNNTNNSNNNTTVAARYIDKDGCGYQTVGNVTYFFMSVNASDHEYFEYRSSDRIGVSCIFPRHSLELPLYSTYVTNIKWSIDGVLWNDFEKVNKNTDNPNHEIGVIYSYSDDGFAGDTIYVMFTAVTNCINPIYVLNDLKENVFDYDNDIFDEKMICPRARIDYKLPEGMEDLPG
ncbi:MAG: hypothetical protein E7653_00165 [Ruminococcaceae bacterium]|nr:hypothetical protein [Oscillospiraceae bacterium]